MRRHERSLSPYHEVNEVSLKMLHTVGFQPYGILEKGKTEIVERSIVPRGYRRWGD